MEPTGRNQPRACARLFLPEEGVVLDADLPQSLRGPVVGQLEANGALKLFVLMGGGRRWCRRRRGGKKHKDRIVKGVQGEVEVWWPGLNVSSALVQKTQSCVSVCWRGKYGCESPRHHVVDDQKKAPWNLSEQVFKH